MPDIKMPYNTDAEEAVLGNILIDPERQWDELEPREELFYSARNKKLFRAMQKLRHSGREIDISSLAPLMKSDDMPSPASWLTSLAEKALPFRTKAACEELRVLAAKRAAI